MNEPAHDIARRWEMLREQVSETAFKCGRNPEEITIVAVTKTHTVDVVRNGIDAGIRVFGENYAQELNEKYEALKNYSGDIQWHFIGHLQTNKVKLIAPIISFIHSVDSLHTAEAISDEAKKNNRTIDILLQVNTSGEDTKSGCEPGDIFKFAESALKIPNINIHGLMTIGSFSDDKVQIRSEFRLLGSLKEKLNQKFRTNQFKELSMGMTGDYDIAIEEGSTYIRVGTAIFGMRNYNR